MKGWIGIEGDWLICDLLITPSDKEISTANLNIETYDELKAKVEQATKE